MPRLRLSIACLVLTCATALIAEEIQFELTDSGVLTHPELGKGIEMRVSATEMPPSEAIDGVLADLCDALAPSVVPFIEGQGLIANPDFIAVRLTAKSGFFFRYALEFFEVEGAECGNAN